MKFIFFLILLFTSLFINAQNGIIRGSIFDKATGEFLPGVKVLVEGTGKGAYTDLDGKFEISIATGKYTLIIRLLSYSNYTISDVIVNDDKVTIVDNIGLSVPVLEIGEVTVKAEYKKNTENALLSLKLRSPNMIDGISAASFRKTGDSDAASAMKRVPGVSIADGKYIFIRGIGDRYNKTILNGMDIPGLDPDRNSLQMDIFPTSVIENMVVSKTFIAELPADFAGGVVDIDLKSFPEEKNISTYISGGYNPSFHFNSNYLDYKGGKTDFLGFDDGTREIPAISNIPLFAQVVGNPNGADGQRYKEILKSFNPSLSALEQSSLMDFGFGASIGNQKKLKKVTLGYNVLFTYNNNTEFYRDAEYGRYGLSGDASVNEMEARVVQKGDMGINNVLMSGMGGIAIKTTNSKFRFNVLHLQNGESSAGIFQYSSKDQGADFEAFQHNLSYSQRSLTNIQLSGNHNLDSSRWKLEWKLSPTFSTINDPDIRLTRYEYRDLGYSISTETGFPERIWRELSEVNYASKLGLEREYKSFGQKASLKFGGGHTYKQRDFIIRNFALNIRGDIPLTGNPDELFSEEMLWPYNNNISMGTTYEAPFIPTNPNQFSSSINNTSAYLSNEMTLGKKLKTIVGIRTEYYTHRYTGRDQLGINVLNNEKVLENLGFFPSLNLVYGVTNKQNLRFSYSKTIARPSFKELSYAEIFDPITGRTFIGGLFKDSISPTQFYWTGNLISTNIHNLDLRWEIMPSSGRTFSVSAFYKKFLNPIEMIQYAVQDGSFQPRNVGDGQVIGGELEIRENLKWISKKLENFAFVFNLTVVDSRIQLNEIEYESRVNNAREGQVIERYRRMAGQAPYVANGGLTYKGTDSTGFLKGFEVGLFYNVQGQTLHFVGIVDRPDVYTVPFHSLNFNVNKKFGKEDNMNIGFKVSNLLNDKVELVYKSFEAKNQFFTRLSPGMAISMKFTYNF